MIEIHRQETQLDHLFSQIKAIPEDQIELRAHWSRYLCVLVSGFIENSVRIIFTELARKQSSPSVANYVSEQLAEFQNPKMEKILNIIRQFNPQWETVIRDATLGELKDSIDSIVQNRHQIAHGSNVGISFHTVQKYYNNTKQVIELIRQVCK